MDYARKLKLAQNKYNRSNKLMANQANGEDTFPKLPIGIGNGMGGIPNASKEQSISKQSDTTLYLTSIRRGVNYIALRLQKAGEISTLVST
jgi:hypothetical protein